MWAEKYTWKLAFWLFYKERSHIIFHVKSSAVIMLSVSKSSFVTTKRAFLQKDRGLQADASMWMIKVKQVAKLFLVYAKSSSSYPYLYCLGIKFDGK